MNINTFLSIFQSADDTLSDVHNRIRVKFLEDWFLRCSFRFKVETLKELLENFNRNIGYEVFKNVIERYPEKLICYVTCQRIPKHNEDRWLHDHNRSLEAQTLKTIKDEYLNWFSQLADVAQISIFFDLLRIGGSSLVIELHNLSLSSDDTYSNESLIVLKTLSSIINYEFRRDSTTEANGSESVALLKENFLGNIKKCALDLEKRVKILYPPSVNEKPDKAQKKTQTKAKKGAKKKTNAAKKGKKAKKQSTKKSRKDKNAIEFEEVDRLQTLPVWVVKKIFNYLDQKTLKKIRAVNSYWEYVVDNLREETKARKYIDKQIKKSQANLQKFEEKYKDNELFNAAAGKLIEKVHLTSAERNLEKLLIRAALHPKLKPKFTKRDQCVVNNLRFPCVKESVEEIKGKPSCDIDEIHYTLLTQINDDLHNNSATNEESQNSL